jgi:hypothetical protein
MNDQGDVTMNSIDVSRRVDVFPPRKSESSFGGGVPEFAAFEQEGGAPKDGGERLAFERLPQLLRVIGATVLIAAALTFMLQSWQSYGHIARYFSFLGLTGVLTVAGIFCGLRVKEDKGARTFLALAVATVPVHFSQLGALLYSKFHPLSELLPVYPEHLLWKAPTVFAALSTTVVGVLAVTLVSLFAFSTLIRSVAARTTLMYVLLNSLLLLPTRSSTYISLLVMGGIFLVSTFDRMQLKGHSVMQTVEGKMCRVMLWIPSILMLARSIVLYGLTPSLLGAVSASIGFLMFFLSPMYLRNQQRVEALQALSAIPLCMGWLSFGFDIISNMHLPETVCILVLILPLGGVFLGMSLWGVSEGVAYRMLAVLAVSMGLLVQLLHAPGIIAAFIAIAAGTMVTAYGYGVQRGVEFNLGLLLIACGLGYHIKLAMPILSMSPWLSLAAFGLVTIGVATYLERNLSETLLSVRRLRERFQ